MHADPIQNEIEEKGLNAPRVRPEDLEAEIAAEFCFVASTGAQYGAIFGDASKLDRLDLLTFCVLVLKNGITVTGQSACVSAENFDAEIGRKIARQNAVNQLWPLLGFRLADKLANETLSAEDPCPTRPFFPDAHDRVQAAAEANPIFKKP